MNATSRSYQTGTQLALALSESESLEFPPDGAIRYRLGEYYIQARCRFRPLPAAFDVLTPWPLLGFPELTDTLRASVDFPFNQRPHPHPRPLAASFDLFQRHSSPPFSTCRPFAAHSLDFAKFIAAFGLDTVAWTDKQETARTAIVTSAFRNAA